jgi:hypothetical protein
MIGFRLCLEAGCLGIFDPVHTHRGGGVFLCLNRSRAKTNGAQSTRKWTQLWAELKPPVWRLRAGSLLHTQQIANSVIAQEVGRHPSSYVKAATAVCSRSRADPELRNQERATREDAATEAALLMLGTGLG